jgi:hypothetical protein
MENAVYNRAVIKAGDEAGELMLVRDILLKRQYDHNHELLPAEPEPEPMEVSPWVETGVRVLFRLAITKITGGIF